MRRKKQRHESQTRLSSHRRKYIGKLGDLFCVLPARLHGISIFAEIGIGVKFEGNLRSNVMGARFRVTDQPDVGQTSQYKRVGRYQSEARTHNYPALRDLGVVGDPARKPVRRRMS